MQVCEILVQLAESPLDAVNAHDSDGVTPLMYAAKAASGGHRTQSQTSAPTEFCAKLIEFRADVTLTDAVGLTALGHLRRGAKGWADFEGVFGYHGAPVVYSTAALESFRHYYSFRSNRQVYRPKRSQQAPHCRRTTGCYLCTCPRQYSYGSIGRE